MGLKFLVFCLLIVEILSAGNPNKVVMLKKTDTSITVDGIIEPAWSKADSAADFFQAQPFFGQKVWSTRLSSRK